jgi:hypothetical protein
MKRMKKEQCSLKTGEIHYKLPKRNESWGFNSSASEEMNCG